MSNIIKMPETRDADRLYSFLYRTADFSREDAEQQSKVGWKSTEQVEAVWNFLYRKWDLSKSEAREKLTELSWKWNCVNHLPESQNFAEDWFSYYYRDVDLTKNQAGQKLWVR